MLPKKNRLDKKNVDLLFKEGKFVVSPSFTLKFILNSPYSEPRISFIAPKSVAKLAVKRNLLRRHGYTALQNHIKDFPSQFLGAFVFKKYQDNIQEIEHEITKILNKIN